MATAFSYSATGNTFLVFDNRELALDPNDVKKWNQLAIKHHVDGIIFLQKSDGFDYEMVYLNADGHKEVMCGNGMRTLGQFAFLQLGLKPGADHCYKVKTANGVYRVRPLDPLSVEMSEIFDEQKIVVSDLYSPAKKSFYINTGVPHTIFEVDEVKSLDLAKIAPPIRHDKRFEKGSNVNFFKVIGFNEVELRTFERGVEGETKSCGTGATATALACARLLGWTERVRLNTPGGILDVTFDENFKNVWLSGAVTLVGQITF